MVFLAREGIVAPDVNPGLTRVAYHDACHAAHAQGIRTEPRALLATIPGIEVLDVADGERCCGAAGIYSVVQPEMAERLGADKAAAIAATRPDAVASANPGCTMQIAAHLHEGGLRVPVVHPVQLLDRAYRTGG
jgi:glycolate oxidase iron-sulfur subunit